ncbi:MAG: ribonuclease P protein component [Terriglobales bacterium]
MPSAPATATNAQTWPKDRRLLRRADFRTTYEQGMRRSSRHFTIFGITRPQAVPGQRFGITASKKLGPAVVRNRIRRRTRELLRRLPPSAACAADFVINPRPSVAEANLDELAHELGEQLQRLCRSLAANP